MRGVSSAGRLANRSTVGAAGRRRQFRADRRRNHPGPCSPLLSGPSGPSSLSLGPLQLPPHARDTGVTPPRPHEKPSRPSPHHTAWVANFALPSLSSYFEGSFERWWVVNLGIFWWNSFLSSLLPQKCTKKFHLFVCIPGIFSRVA